MNYKDKQVKLKDLLKSITVHITTTTKKRKFGRDNSNKPIKRKFRTSITPELEQVLAENNRVKQYKNKYLTKRKVDALRLTSFKDLATVLSPSSIYNHERDRKKHWTEKSRTRFIRKINNKKV